MAKCFCWLVFRLKLVSNLLHRRIAFLLILIVASAFPGTIFGEDANEPQFENAKSRSVPFARFGTHSVTSDRVWREVIWREHRCGNCHSNESRGVSEEELGPNLSGIIKRRPFETLKSFLRDPHSVIPGSAMPHIAWKDETEIEQVLAFLETNTTPIYLPIPRSKDGDPQASSFERGKQLFQSIGCIACHGVNPLETKTVQVAEVNPPMELETEVRPHSVTRPLAHVRKRYGHEELTSFLLNPDKSHPASKMPRFQLEVLEAADLAHYLLGSRIALGSSAINQVQRRLENSNGELLSAQAKTGRRLFIERGCVQCHAGLVEQTEELDVVSRFKSESELDWSKWNTAHGSNESSTRIDLAEDELRILSTPTSQSDNLQSNSRDRLSIEILSLNCLACHSRKFADDLVVGGVPDDLYSHFRNERDIDLGDEGKLPPSLTLVGAKWKTEPLGRVVELGTKLRPHMFARMPGFGVAKGKRLSELFTEVDLAEIPDSTDLRKVLQSGDSAAGRVLLNTGCVQCHAFRGKQATGVLGIDLANCDERLREEWFQKHLLNPAAVRQRTRMPNFFQNGISASPDILGGDIDSQIAAMWTFLNDRTNKLLPEKIANDLELGFEIIPDNEPVILRTFMDVIGERAIAVGNPSKSHFAFDAERCGTRLFWKGRFIDAHGTWYDRFAPPARPLSSDSFELPKTSGLAIVNGASILPNSQKRFLGYRLDDSGNPEFEYSLNGHLFNEKILCGEAGWVVEVRGKVKANSPTFKFLIAPLDLDSTAEPQFSFPDFKVDILAGSPELTELKVANEQVNRYLAVAPAQSTEELLWKINLTLNKAKE